MPRQRLAVSNAGLIALVPVTVLALLLTAGIALDAVGLAGPTEASPSSSGQTTLPKGHPAAGTALEAVQGLTVKGRAPFADYDRDRFGQRWADIDRNGCDQRNDILRRDLTGFATKAGTDGCKVLSGHLADPFTGKGIKFKRGYETSTEVHIDHVVALADAWQKGAQQWDENTRERFANDFFNLVAVDGPTNMAKGAGDAATWLPPNKAYRCTYVAQQVAVKQSYQLWVTQAEQDAMVQVLSTCSEAKLPTRNSSSVPARDTAADEQALKIRPEQPDPDRTPTVFNRTL